MGMLIHPSREYVFAGRIDDVIRQTIEAPANCPYHFSINQDISFKFSFCSQNYTIFYQFHSISL